MYIRIIRNSSTPLIRQIYKGLKNMILDGDLKAGEMLPSTRKLAKELRISRNIIVEVYEMLTAEGYTRSVKGSGTFVNNSVSIIRPKQKIRKIEITGMKDSSGLISFRSGRPALDSFPSSKWIQCYRDAVFSMKQDELGYDYSNGYLPFRKTLSEYLFRSRGIQCHEDQLVITSGAVQALYLAAKYFDTQDGVLLFEEPTTGGLRKMLEFNHSDIIYTNVDDEGIIPENLPVDEKVSSIFTTPSHQYPIGGSLTVQRRVELIKYARKHKCFIVEDDYDSEFRYDKAPVESLYELDPELVIYIGSFSKIFIPGIRIGYMVLPEVLIEKICSIKGFVDIHCPTLNQAAMEKFINKGYLEQHLFAVKKLYRKRRKCLIDNIKNIFGENAEILGSKTGIHITVRFKNVIFTEQLMNKIISNGVYLDCVSSHAAEPSKHMSELIFGYSNLTEQKIIRGLNILAECLQDMSSDM